MLRRRLILIEGMIGSGTSTTAERLAARLTQAGENVRAFLEFADDHPIRTKGADRARMVDPPSADAYAVSQWDVLAARCASGSPAVILESAFLQNSVMPCFIDDCGLTAVKEAFAEIAVRIAPVMPLLVYLRRTDIADAIRRVHAERGEPWSSRNYAFVSACAWARRRGLVGAQAVIELYRAWEPVVDDLLATVESVVIADPQRDWDGTLQQLSDAVRGEER